VLVEAELRQDSVEAGIAGAGHEKILKQNGL